MKKSHVLMLSTLGVFASGLLTQCAKPHTLYNKKGQPVATALTTPQGYVTSQRLGDTTVVTRRLINRAL